MKSIMLGFCFFVSFLFSGCQKSSDIFTNDAVVAEDCSGTYLTIGNQHYKVCGPIIFPFDNHKKVKVTYYRIDECNASKKGKVCLLGHEHDGYIRVIAARIN